MLSIRRPSPELLRRFLDQQSKSGFSYADIGATATAPPAGFAVDRSRVKLGEGETVFQSARQALTLWKHFDLGWTEAWPATPIRAGETVAVVIRAMGLWWLNAAQIVYVVDESANGVSRFGYAYGTLPGHAEMGEERFLVEWDHASGDVWYEIFAFSRPRHVLARLGRWQVRRLQRRFHRDSAAAMSRALRDA